jgi:hypothetical protein
MTLRDFRNIILLVLSSILTTVIIPGVFSSIGGTFYLKDIKLKISKSQSEKLTEFESEEWA